MISAKKIRPYVKVLLLGAVLGAGVYIFSFAQNDFYPALTGSQTVFALQKNMAAQAVDVNKFDKLVENIDQKTSSSSLSSSVTDPFR
ncbi:MAG: hypothetical protein PHE24_02285 [Patescibacteria group bacterium]|nr:hypothetical protein [Patescibacteria group bacterium]